MGLRIALSIVGVCAGAALCLPVSGNAAAPATPAPAAERPIAYLTQRVDRPAPLSNQQWRLPPDDEGVSGARLAVRDNNSTGRFTGQAFSLAEWDVPADGDVVAAFNAIVAEGHRFVIANLEPLALDRVLAAPGLDHVLVFNVRATDDRFRNADCRLNVLHTVPSRAMLADALAQYLIKKQWRTWFLVTGTEPADVLYAAALRRAAKRFGGRIVEAKTWDGAHDARRTAEEEVPLLTQGSDYDVLLVADEIGFFGDYLLYRTWRPRPVAGTQGLVPAAWDRTVEQWGAAQLQNRFRALAGRAMTATDYAAWVAIRAIGEAATQAKSVAFDAIRSTLLSDRFELAAFKGRKVSFRRWDRQLRQPIPVTAERALVSMSPQPGFLHQISDLDTLGDDAPDSRCPFPSNG